MRDGSPNAETTDGTNIIFSWPTAILEYVSSETSVPQVSTFLQSTAVTEPPGESMYMTMSLLGSAASKYNSCATIKFAMSSSTVPPHRIILCWKSCVITL
jgi:hypothetical protein